MIVMTFAVETLRFVVVLVPLCVRGNTFPSGDGCSCVVVTDCLFFINNNEMRAGGICEMLGDGFVIL